MEIKHDKLKTISTYTGKENQKDSRIRKSSSTSTLINKEIQKKYESRINYPSNITILTPMKVNQPLPNMKLKFNEPKIIPKALNTRNPHHNINNSNSPFIFKSFDNINQYHGKFKALVNSRGTSEVNRPELKIKAHRKPFNDKFILFFDKKDYWLKQQLSEKCLLAQNPSMNNNNTNDNNNDRLSNNNFNISPNRKNRPKTTLNWKIVSENNIFLQNKEKHKEKKEKLMIIENKAKANPETLAMSEEKYKEKEDDKKNENNIDRIKVKGTKQSELKTDTDSKGRNTNKQYITETSRMTNNTQIMNIHTANDSQTKRHQKSKNEAPKPKHTNDIKISSDLITQTPSQYPVPSPNTQYPDRKKYTIHLPPLVTKTGIRLIDAFTKNISQSLSKNNHLSIKMKRDCLWSQIEKLHQNRINLCNTTSLNNTNHQPYIPQFNHLILSNDRNNWDIDYLFLELGHHFSLPFSVIYYLTSTYLLIDSSAISDYIFNIKSNLFQNYQIKRGVRIAHTKKTNIFKNLSMTNDDNYIKTSLLYLQRFIQNDFNLTQCKQIDKDCNRNHRNLIALFPKKRGKLFSLLSIIKNEDYNLSLLRKRRFFLLENNEDIKINQVLLPRHSIKDINLSLMLPEIKKLIQDLNDCLMTNKYNRGQDSTNEIMNALLSTPLLFDLFIKLIQCNASGLIDKCLKYKTDFNIDMQDYNGNTLLIIAIKLNELSFVQYLLEKGANSNLQNNYGNTAMHYAVAHKNFAVVDSLTHYGGREDILNNNRMTPWECGNKNLEDND